MMKGPGWFAPKRYGYGAGLPIAWRGWALLLGYVGMLVGAAMLLGDRPVAFLGIILPATLILLLIASKTTRGGRRWRWGDKE